VTELQQLVPAELGTLASALADLDEAAWSTPSLCAGWTVRYVVAHLTMAARYDAERFGAELAADGFDFQTTSDRIAARDADLPVAELLDDVRSPRLAAFEQPGGGWAGSLSHVVIHGLDITLGLGLGRVAGDEATRRVLDGLVSTGVRTVFGVDVAGRRLRATDLDWEHGSGTAHEATAGELVAMLSGRQVI
jgi:uncharacterized protein (TIGR03083 family)